MVQKENPKIQTFTEEELVNLLMTAPSKKEIVFKVSNDVYALG